MKRYVWQCPICKRKSVFYVPVKNATCPSGRGHSDPEVMIQISPKPVKK